MNALDLTCIPRSHLMSEPDKAAFACLTSLIDLLGFSVLVLPTVRSDARLNLVSVEHSVEIAVGRHRPEFQLSCVRTDDDRSGGKQAPGLCYQLLCVCTVWQVQSSNLRNVAYSSVPPLACQAQSFNV